MRLHDYLWLHCCLVTRFTLVCSFICCFVTVYLTVTLSSAQDSVQLLALLCDRAGGTDAGAPSHGHVLKLESARALPGAPARTAVGAALFRP